MTLYEKRLNLSVLIAQAKEQMDECKNMPTLYREAEIVYNDAKAQLDKLTPKN